MKMEHAEDAGPLDEAALVMAAQGDLAAFEPLYERYVNALYRYAYHRVGNHADAEDVTSQTFQQAIAALPAYEWRGAPFGAWLFKIAANVIARRARSAGREIAVDAVAVYAPEHAGEDPAAVAATSDIVTALGQLPLDQQRAIVLKFSHGLTSREIGEALNRSEGAAKQLIHRALIAMRAALESDSDE
ncbi:MAG TPA: sigma-70 family RNA polymerase sigma factor [Nitrolancea sp.]|jgi:RNA polymerase sigma-70 factor (ECF subfamily)|nr:sigma-70 family RNA polymerase sigma factor [Nitrolancea sp.]